MGQKINPFGYRLGITEDHRSKWFSDSNKAGERYRDFVLEDDAIRKEMTKDLERAGVSRSGLRGELEDGDCIGRLLASDEVDHAASLARRHADVTCDCFSFHVSLLSYY